MHREVFLRLSEQVGAQLAAKGVSESEVLDDFAASRKAMTPTTLAAKNTLRLLH